MPPKAPPSTTHGPPPTILPDFLCEGLRIVFIGFNPGTRSGAVGHYYAGPGNLFWPFLHEAGFTDRRLTYDEDHLVLSYGIGLTDFAKRTTPGIADLTTEDYRSGFVVLQQKLARFGPGFICFNGKSGYQKAVNERREYGLQPDTIHAIPIYLAPSTSGALPMRREEKLHHYREARRLSAA